MEVKNQLPPAPIPANMINYLKDLHREAEDSTPTQLNGNTNRWASHYKKTIKDATTSTELKYLLDLHNARILPCPKTLEQHLNRKHDQLLAIENRQATATKRRERRMTRRAHLQRAV
jgi:hypothetical protein